MPQGKVTPRMRLSMLALDLIAQLRVHQWVKNILVFVSPFAAHLLFQPGALGRLMVVFAAFCAAASGVYIVNDLVDLETDRAHPRKRDRPFASGRLPLALGALGPVLMLVGIGLSFWVSRQVSLVVVGYLVLSSGYSFYLKTKPLVDVFTLSALYTIRLYAGEAALQIEPSMWLLSFSGFMFLSLAFLKRVSEYEVMIASKSEYEMRRGYTHKDAELLKTMGVCSSFIATMVLGLYINTESAAAQYEQPIALWASVPIFLFWQSRMWLAAERGKMTDDPIVYAARDWVSQLCLVMLLAIYLVASFF